MSKSDEFHDQRIKISDPVTKPDVPEFAERMSILEHVRHQFQPMFLNAIGAPDIYGPKFYVGLDLRCPMCQHIQPLVPPGEEGKCARCQLRYKYTAAKGNSWLWIWRQQPKLDLDGLQVQAVSGPESNVQKSAPLVEVPVGGSVEVHRSFRPGAKHDPQKSNGNQSGFVVNVHARKKDE
jgi:hypothetical protein